MKIHGKEINDECVKCGEILNCQLFLDGHGINTPRKNISAMFSCQMRHKGVTKDNGQVQKL